MTDVSCRTAALVLAGMEAHGVAVEPCLEGLPVTRAELSDPTRRVRWELFAELMDRVETAVGGPAGMEELFTPARATLHPFVRVARLAGPGRVYQLLASWGIPGDYRVMRAKAERRGDRDVRLTVTIDAARRGSSATFRFMLGSLRRSPRLLGRGDTQVTAEITPHRAVYDLVLADVPSVFRRVKRATVGLLATRTLLDELDAQQREILTQNRMLEERLAEQHQAERALRESEARFRAAAEGSLDAFFLLHAVRDARGAIVDFTFVDVNRRGEAMLGLPRAAIVGARLCALRPVNRADGFLEKYAAVVDERQPMEEEFSVDLPEGQRWRRHQVVAVGDGVAITTRDVTEVRRDAEALRAREEQLRLALAAGEMGTWSWEVQSGAVTWSSEVMRLFGGAGGAFDGTFAGYLALLHPDDTAMVTATLERAVAEGSAFDIEHRIGRGDATRWLACRGTASVGPDGRTARLAGTVMDVTARKEAAIALKRSEERLRLALLATDQALWDCDLRTGEIYTSPRYAEMLGYVPGALARTLEARDALVHPEDREALRAARGAHMSGRTASYEVEYRVRAAAGDWCWIADRGRVAERDAQGNAVRMIGTYTDISEKKRIEARLLLADRMISVGTLAAGVAHELNNPLAYVIGNVEVLEMTLPELRQAAHRGGGDTGLLEEALAAIGDGARRVRDIVRDLKTFSRADEDRKTAVDVRHVLDVSIRMALHDLRHRARVVRDFGAVPATLGNESRLGQVFLNLLVNAAHAMPERDAEQNEIRVSAKADAQGNAVVEVTDNGVGMSEETARHIFDPFFTTKPIGVGTGLGLSICHNIVSAAGGRIEVESAVGAGTTFRVVLPPARARGTRPAAPASAAERTARARVLVVDDEAHVVTLLENVLADAGHEVVGVTSGREALARIAAGGTFDVIVCDVMMPDVTGMDVHAELARTSPSLAERMVFLTGGAFTRRAQAFLDGSPHRRLDKPFSAADVLRKIAEVVQAEARRPVAAEP